MSKIRAQVITKRATHLAIDHIVNTVYFDDFNLPGGNGTDWQAMADDVRGVFNARNFLPVGYGTEVKVYDMADAEPRPIKATAPWALATSSGFSSEAPREVALCLSYYSERNLPRFRGRLYIGPFYGAALRPTTVFIDAVKAIATGLQNVGSVDVDWGLWSPTRNAFSKITNGWVDDEWDTVRSRGLKATLRSVYTTNE
jgi:hypothetical protein